VCVCVWCHVRRQLGVSITTSETTFKFPSITFTLFLRRQPLYYVVNVVVPCFLLSFLAATTFLLQAECYERLGLGRFSFVAFASLTIIQGVPIKSIPYNLLPITHKRFKLIL